jgi:hypothetical protein
VGLAALDRAQPQRDRRGQAYFGLPTKVNLVEDVAAELLLERLRVRFSLAWSQAAKNSDSALLKLDDPTTRRLITNPLLNHLLHDLEFVTCITGSVRSGPADGTLSGLPA